jgi:hypothetical protein
MAHGGSRKHPPDCKCGNCPRIGRPKQERATNANVALKVLKEAKVEQLWLTIIEIERLRLGINKDGTLSKAAAVDEKSGVVTGPDYQGRFSIIPLVNTLRYLEDRAHGRPMDTVNHVHNKPIEMHHTFSISDRLRRARERVAGVKHD